MESAGFSRRCMGMSVSLRVVPSSTGLHESFAVTNTVTKPIINVCQLAYLWQSQFISVSK